MAVRQPGFLPRFAGVGGPINAVSLHDVAAEFRLPHADIHDVGIRFRNRDSPHRRTTELSVSDGLPCGSAICGLPESAVYGAKVVFIGSAWAADAGKGSPAPVRTYVAPFQ